MSFTRGHSIPDSYHLPPDSISHNPLHGLINTHCLHLWLIYTVCSPYIYFIYFLFSHLADAFVQSDLQMRAIEAIKIYNILYKPDLVCHSL